MRNRANDVLIALRQHESAEQAQAIWEFPGGKFELGETAYEALCRELYEEIGIQVINALPILQIPYQYAKTAVLLHCWEVVDYQGNAYSKEGQVLEWAPSNALSRYTFLAANHPIVSFLTQNS